jgi:hypothetical protein
MMPKLSETLAGIPLPLLHKPGAQLFETQFSADYWGYQTAARPETSLSLEASLSITCRTIVPLMKRPVNQ